MHEQTNEYHLGVLKDTGDMVLRRKSETKDPYNLEGENRRGKVMQYHDTSFVLVCAVYFWGRIYCHNTAVIWKINKGIFRENFNLLLILEFWIKDVVTATAAGNHRGASGGIHLRTPGPVSLRAGLLGGL